MTTSSCQKEKVCQVRDWVKPALSVRYRKVFSPSGTIQTTFRTRLTPIPGSWLPGLSDKGPGARHLSSLGLLSRLITFQIVTKQVLTMIEIFSMIIPKVFRAKIGALPCDNHARKMRTFFTCRLEPNVSRKVCILVKLQLEHFSSNCSKTQKGPRV